MRNLRGIARQQRSISPLQAPDLPLTATAWDAAQDHLICIFGPSEESPVVEVDRLENNGELTTISSWDYFGPCQTPNMPVDKVLSLHILPETGIICLVFAGGDVVAIDERSLASKVEIMGSVDDGLKAANWSPDDGVLALVTGANNLVLMTSTFEPITDVPMKLEDLQSSQHVNVGWGKKETQFKGKRAASMRDPTMPETVDEGLLSEHDDKRIRISWRGDGAFFAVSSIEQEKRRVTRVYNRDGTLDSISEPVDYLEGTLSWRPSGNLIAAIQRTKTDLQVVFFERNGLRHGEFSLRIPLTKIPETRVQELTWNADSSVLAVVLNDRVQLWTMGNYHWYLKKEYFDEVIIETPFSSTLQHVRCTIWHPEKSLKLAVFRDGVAREYHLTWAMNADKNYAPYDYGLSAVIDGSLLKLTPLRLANIPPPMAFRETQISDTPVDVAISQDGSSIAVLRRESIDILTWDLKQKLNKITIQHHKEVISFTTIYGEPRQICFGEENVLAVLFDNKQKEEHNTFVQYVLSSSGQWTQTNKRDWHEVQSIFPSSDHKYLYYSRNDGSIWALFPNPALNGKGLHESDCILQNTEKCLSFEVYKFTQGSIIFGLAENGRLFANQQLLVQGCTSFTLTTTHLIFTTSKNFLKFVPFQNSVEDLVVPTDDPTSDELCRSIERGGKLVSVMPSIFSLTLQMPRGNLETVFPRALVLTGIRKSVEKLDYKTAFMSCRVHRVDMNILHDHMPEQFMASIKDFIDQVQKTSYIDLFLSSLRDEDVTQTMFRQDLPKDTTVTISSAKAAPVLKAVEVTGKTNRICGGFLKVFEDRPSQDVNAIQNIITAHVCKKPADLDAALLVVGNLRAKNMEMAEQAIEHACFLSDFNKLYENALGLYDLDITLMVAQQSQKDPREYLPFLQSVKDMTDNRRKFFLDDYLGRYSKAANTLHSMEDDTFDELSDYTIKHELYQEVMKLCEYQKEKRNIILGLYANHLNNRSDFKQAGLAYEYLGKYDIAVEAYRKGGMWRESLFVAARVPLSDQEIEELSYDLVEALLETKEYFNAAQVYLEYRDDITEALRSLCKGYLFDEALRVVALKKQFDLVDSVIDPGLVDAFNTTSELIADCKGQVIAQVNRIRELRVKKEEDPLAYFDGVTEVDAPDNVSLAPTDSSTAAGSIYTRYTGKTKGTLNTMATRKTSKNKRREDRKKARGKKGSVYEEEYLVASIGRLIERLESNRAETGRLVQALFRRNMRERAGAVQRGFDEVMTLLSNSVDEVYAESSLAANTYREVDDNGEVVEKPAVLKAVVPVIKRFDEILML